MYAFLFSFVRESANRPGHIGTRSHPHPFTIRDLLDNCLSTLQIRIKIHKRNLNLC
jgi:hypothetical protein